ncbi:N-acetylmuramoyl-L-alanine amidase family protein [Arcobacter aquimarinus]|uniref:N-acetylmuramoyl-L-alanine amidase n=1 Tax=Arcobacter aquimarinus TaxID=1315211 RepID=A0AAE7B6M3_9BACT|nr:N-acetylmuramoyl-L-alanine amidase [Arcobacter aquimarinus]QKE26517.1 N-acetylmuramoyl-L-alanine amidase [Arcobacter aquimarinus]
MKKDEEQKIEELNKIISFGEKLNKDVRPDKKKLELLLEKKAKTNIVKSNLNKNIEIKNNTKVNNNKNTNNQKILYSIQSVYSKNNQIIIDFNVDITQEDIKAFKLNQPPLYKNVFDINGYFKDAIPTKLTLNGIDKVTLGQFQPNILRIVLSNQETLNTSYTISKRQVVITVNNIKTKSNPSVMKNENSISNPVENIEESNIDTQNEIRSITSIDDKIIVKFNKNYTKNDIKFKSFTNNKNFETIFDIKGKYKYVNPTKLNISGIDKIITTQNNTNTVRIRFINNSNTKITYSLNNKELIVTPVVLNNENTKQKTQIITKKQINKTIVIDAGHGGDDVGAVGPKKRYEKVVNLSVSKYLASILKQRGYKVYLTRDKDKFIKVMDRTILANDKNADLFLSIHTNAVPKEKANQISGIETFFLSPARSERAKRVAALENKSDIREMSASSKNVFLESLNRPRITASHKFAIDVQAGLLQAARTKYKDTKDSGVREGPFWVLVGAQMPSILIELGYISHPEESRRLYEKNYQELLANGIANGIDSYFSKNP